MKKLTIPTAEPFFLPGGKTGCILVHGFTGSPKEMRLLGDHLNSYGVTVQTIRLVGHATNINDMPRIRWRDWLASVEDGFNLLAGNCDKIFIAGLSMGGILSLLAASIYPLQGAIAMSTPFTITNDWRIKFAKPISKFIPFIKKDNKDLKNVSTKKTHVEYASYPTRSIAELVLLIKEMRQNLKNINIPILMINSKSDQTVPINHQRLFKQQIKNEFLESIVLEKSGHVITEDVERIIVFDEVYKFIQKHT